MPPAPDELAVTSTVRIPFSEFEFTASRSSGPGGQNVNKVNSRIQLRWNPTTSPSIPPEVAERFIKLAGKRMTKDGSVLITGQEHRDAPKNKADCLERLAELLRAALVKPRVRKATKPSRGSKERRLKAKRQRSETKQSRRTPAGEG
jgi:ribosome-associated protein